MEITTFITVGKEEHTHPAMIGLPETSMDSGFYNRAVPVKKKRGGGGGGGEGCPFATVVPIGTAKFK